jgi:hypothetical protein
VSPIEIEKSRAFALGIATALTVNKAANKTTSFFFMITEKDSNLEALADASNHCPLLVFISSYLLVIASSFFG